MSVAQLTPPARDWRRLGNLPRRGWSLLEVADLEEAAHECEACGYPSVRYVHYLGHPSADCDLAVGCCCAEHLTGDHAGPRRAEGRLHNRGARLRRLLDPASWRRTRAGNRTVTYRGVRLVLYRSRFAAGWRINVGDRLGQVDHPSGAAAVRAAFRYLDPATAPAGP